MIDKPKVMIDKAGNQYGPVFGRRILYLVFQRVNRLFQFTEFEGPEFPLDVQDAVEYTVHRYPFDELR